MSRANDQVLFEDDRDFEAVSVRLRKDANETAFVEIRYHDAELAIELEPAVALEMGKALIRWAAGRATEPPAEAT